MSHMTVEELGRKEFKKEKTVLGYFENDGVLKMATLYKCNFIKTLVSHSDHVSHV